VIGADGLRSVIARRVHGVRRGRRDRLALVGRYRPRAGFAAGPAGPTEPGVGDLRLSGAGCLGAAAIEDGLWNVTVVVPRTRAGEVSSDPFGFYQRAVGGYGFAPPAEPADLVTGLEVTGPFEIAPNAVTAPGVVLAGDAAGYFDPFTGQGIYRALVSGGRAAEAVGAALADPGRAAAFRGGYEADLHEMFDSSRRLQKLVDFVIHRPRLVNTAGALFERRPGLLSMLLDATGDRDRPEALLWPSRIAPALRTGSA
jgi:flavin-dependent dehydrogenase